MKIKYYYILSLFILLSISLKAQTSDDLYEAMQNLEYGKAETISLNMIKQEIDYKSAKSLIDHSYAHYSLGAIYSFKKYNKFNFNDSYNHLLQSKLIIEIASFNPNLGV
jgi:hypothetical protein